MSPATGRAERHPAVRMRGLVVRCARDARDAPISSTAVAGVVVVAVAVVVVVVVVISRRAKI